MQTDSHSPRGTTVRLILCLLLPLWASAMAAVQYEYDDNGRISRVTDDSGVVIDYSYDANGNLLQRLIAEVLDSALSFSVAQQTFVESDGSVQVEVSRSGSSSGSVSIDYAFVDQSAIQGADYVASDGTLTWSDGDSTPRQISIDLIDDVLMEGDEQFQISLSNATGNAQLGSITLLQVTLLDDDTPLFADGFED